MKQYQQWHYTAKETAVQVVLPLDVETIVGLQYMLDTGSKKKVQEDAKSVIVELRKQRSRKEHLLHEEYNTKHEVSAIPDELRAAVRGEGGEQEV